MNFLNNDERDNYVELLPGQINSAVDPDQLKKKKMAALLAGMPQNGQSPFNPMPQQGQTQQPNPVQTFFDSMKMMNAMRGGGSLK